MLQIIAISIFLLGFTQSFQHPFQNKITIGKSLSALRSSGQNATEPLQTNGDETLADRLAIQSNAKRSRRRTADFPSFSYEISSRPSRNEKPIGMKYKGCGCENVKFKKPPTVIIPEDDSEDMGILGKAAVGLAGGFEGGLGSIGLSASRTRLLKNRAYARKEGMTSVLNVFVWSFR